MSSSLIGRKRDEAKNTCLRTNARRHLAPMRLRYDDELDEALAWSEWFCHVTGLFLDRDAIEIGRRYWAV